MHYAVPRIFSRAGLLECLFTDACAVKGWPRLLRILPRILMPRQLQRLMARIPKGIPTNQITAFTDFGFRYSRRIAQSKTANERNGAFLWSGQEFNRRILARGFGKAQTVYVYNSAGLELLQEARRRGLKGIVEQTIAPRAIEWSLLTQEQASFPDWEAPTGEGLTQEYCAREAAEWAAADLILCASEFVRDGILACGGSAERSAVVPYGIDHAAISEKPTRLPGPLRVLTVGAVGLRKGAPYVLAAAKGLASHAEFRMVGEIQVLSEAETQLREHIELVGVVSRSEMQNQYQWADVFLLPSLCEGSSTATYEALFKGLPVICTSNTGSVVRNGVDGFIVPVRDGQAIIERLAELAGNPKLLTDMSKNAIARSSDYTLEKYSERLLSVLRERHLL